LVLKGFVVVVVVVVAAAANFKVLNIAER